MISPPRILILFLICLGLFLFSCRELPSSKMAQPDTTISSVIKTVKLPSDTSPVTIFARKEIPVLCYHQLRERRATDSKRAQDYIVPPAVFTAQMKYLADSGFHPILPDQLYRYLKYGESLPSKSVLIQFDDADLSQFEVAKPILDRFGFKASFFIMTVVLGRKGYMNAGQVKQLSDEGHLIGSHSWDHKNVKIYTVDDWKIQVEKPSALLQRITGKPVKYFAYPFGLWDHKACQGLAERGFLMAFQLQGKRNSSLPLFAIRRSIIPGYYSMKRFGQIVKAASY